MQKCHKEAEHARDRQGNSRDGSKARGRQGGADQCLGCFIPSSLSVQMSDDFEIGIYALYSLAYRNSPPVQVADNIGLPTDEGLFGFKPFPEVSALSGCSITVKKHRYEQQRQCKQDVAYIELTGRFHS